MSDDVVTGVSGYSFSPDHLKTGERTQGISAFMRIKNGAEFLEATIRSHIHELDEIVAVFNGCTDATEDILRAMQAEYGSKLRVFHYEDRVFPPGSDGHKTTQASSPNSIVNYSNFALAQTRHSIVTKLDDDHLAIEQPWRQLARRARQDLKPNQLLAFSGINLIRPKGDPTSTPEVLLNAPISGKGDIGFFRVNSDSFFHHDPRFERFSKGRWARTFGAFTYWHLKFLKSDVYGNYELTQNPNSRFARLRERLDDFDSRPLETWRLEAGRRKPLQSMLAAISDKQSIARDQRRQLRAGQLDETAAEGMQRLALLQKRSSNSFGAAP